LKVGEYIRPLPVPDGDTKPYWDAAREHRLIIQRCQNCQQAIFYPRSVCPHCMSDHIAWIEASGKSRLAVMHANNDPLGVSDLLTRSAG
jgi:uncharacterized OB-fold protein